MHILTSFVVFVLLWICSTGAFAAGFAVLQQGTVPMGQGNAFVAQADDPSAIFFNPAGISRLEKNHAYLGSTLVLPKATYESRQGLETETESNLFILPQLYLTHNLPANLTAGIAVFSPFGVGTRWPDE